MRISCVLLCDGYELVFEHPDERRLPARGEARRNNVVMMNGPYKSVHASTSIMYDDAFHGTMTWR